MNLPTALSVWCAVVATRDASPRWRSVVLSIAAGAFAGVATLYKYQAALVVPGLLVLSTVRTLPARLASIALGFLLPFAATALFFWHRDSLAAAIHWGIEFNLHYLAEGPGFVLAAQRLGMQLLGVVLPSILLYGAGAWSLWLLVRRRPGSGALRGGACLVVWGFLSLGSVALGRRFFGHYFLQPELPLSVLAAAPVASLWERRLRLTAGLLALPALLFFVIAGVPEVFAPIVYAGDPDYVTIGRAVAAKTQKRQTIWVWGNVPQIYFTAERMPGARFTFCNYLTGLSPGSRSELDPTYDPRQNIVPGAWDMAIGDLMNQRPVVIVDTAAGGMKSYGKFPISSFPAFARVLADSYERDGEILGAVLYRRKPELDASAVEHLGGQQRGRDARVGEHLGVEAL
jgi:hypothetical protein